MVILFVLHYIELVYHVKFKVDGNGRLVPATDDEVIAVEDLLEDDKGKVRSTDTGQTPGCSINDGSEPCGSETAGFNGSGPITMLSLFIFSSLLAL